MKTEKLGNRTFSVYLITGCVLLSYIIHLILLCRNPSGSQLNIFFGSLKDFFADFFNVLRYVAGRDVYFNEIGGGQESPYLPLSYMLLYPFSCLNNYGSMSLSDCWSSRISIMSVFMYTFFSLAVFIHALVALIKKYNVNKIILLPILLSNIVLFSVERGNLVIISAAGAFYFLAFFDSENRMLRYFALFMLVFASVLKFYPVILGFLLLKEKRYKDILYCIILGVLLTILPFFFFKRGLMNIPLLLSNLKLHYEAYRYGIFPRFGVSHLFYHIVRKLLNNEIGPTVYIITQISIRLICVFSVFLSYKTKDEFLSLALLIFPILFFPTNSGYYCGVYLMPLIVMTPNLFLKNKKTGIIFIIYSILCLQCIQILFKIFNLTQLFVNFFTLLIFVYVLVITLLKIKADKEVK